MKPATLLILAACAFFMWPHEAKAARFIRASVSLNGKMILEGSTSDDGYTDADGVWEYPKSIKFKPTEEFKKLKIDPATKETVLSSKGPRGEAGGTVVDIAYGGKAMPRSLKLVRVPIDERGREWSFDPAEVDGMFNRRLISRELASQLRKPDKLKPWGSGKR